MRWLWLVMGALAIISGTIWTLQGLDMLGQAGGMNGEKIWAVIGPITVLIGLFLVLTSLPKRKPKP